MLLGEQLWKDKHELLQSLLEISDCDRKPKMVTLIELILRVLFQNLSIMDIRPA